MLQVNVVVTFLRKIVAAVFNNRTVALICLTTSNISAQFIPSDACLLTLHAALQKILSE